MNLPWDRVERIAAWVLAAASLGLALLEFIATRSEWRYELARSQDAAGLYLFFTGPLLLAICAFSAQRRVRAVRDFAPALPNPLIGVRASWVKYYALACVLHVMVMVCYLAYAWSQDAHFTALSAQPLIRQFLTLMVLAALGSMIGSYAKSVLLPGVALTLTLLIAVAIPGTGLRDFLLVGAGTVDFSYWRYSGLLFVLVGLALLATVLPTLPLRNLTRGLSTSRVLAANAAAAGAVFLMLSGPQVHELKPANRALICQIQEPTVCGPKGSSDGMMRVADAAQAVRNELPTGALRSLPERLVISSGIGVGGNPTAVVFTSEMLGNPSSALRTVISATAGMTACARPSTDDPLAPNSNWRAAAVVAGWLEAKLSVEPLTFNGAQVAYPEELDVLLQLSGSQQDTIVSGLVADIYRCGPVDLSQLQ